MAPQSRVPAVERVGWRFPYPCLRAGHSAELGGSSLKRIARERIVWILQKIQIAISHSRNQRSRSRHCHIFGEGSAWDYRSQRVGMRQDMRNSLKQSRKGANVLRRL